MEAADALQGTRHTPPAHVDAKQGTQKSQATTPDRPIQVSRLITLLHQSYLHLCPPPHPPHPPHPQPPPPPQPLLCASRTGWMHAPGMARNVHKPTAKVSVARPRNLFPRAISQLALWRVGLDPTQLANVSPWESKLARVLKLSQALCTDQCRVVFGDGLNRLVSHQR